MRATLALLTVAITVVVTLFYFQPKGIPGPRAPEVAVEGRGFPYEALNPALALAFPSGDEEGGPRYDLLSATPEPLDRYLGLISEIGPRSAPHRFTRREERLAYVLNAYNAGLLAIIRARCPLQSVRDPYIFQGLFWRVSLRVGGEEVSLNDLAAEASALAQGDPRVYLALNKGARAGIPLRRTAWTPNTLEAGLAALESALLSPPMVTRSGDQLVLGAPFKWYEFQLTPNPIDFIRHRAPKLVESVKGYRFIEEDWSLEGRCSL